MPTQGQQMMLLLLYYRPQSCLHAFPSSCTQDLTLWIQRTVRQHCWWHSKVSMTSLLSISLPPALFFPSLYNSNLALAGEDEKGQSFMENTVTRNCLKIKRHRSSWEQSSTPSSLVYTTVNNSQFKTANFLLGLALTSKCSTRRTTH